jgi:hypothetical protein
MGIIQPIKHFLNLAVMSWFHPFTPNIKMSTSSIKQPFQSGYLMNISRCVERLEIAQSGHFSKPIKRQLSAQCGLLGAPKESPRSTLNTEILLQGMAVSNQLYS